MHLKKIIYKIYKSIFKPLVLKKIITSKSQKPRMRGQKNAEVLALKGSDSDIFEQILSMRSKIFNGFYAGQKVLLKVNLNTRDPYPASTDAQMLNIVIDCLNNMGIEDVIIGDCSAISRLPSRREYNKTRLFNIVENKAKLVFFDEEKWVNVEIDGEYIKKVTIPEIVYDVDKIIYLTNLKCHRMADFSFGTKLAVGFMHPLERIEMHKSNLHEKIAEISLAVQPDLIFLDGREAFITGGPDKGDVARGDVVFVGNDLLSVDEKGYMHLYSLKKENNCIEGFSENPFDMRQLKHLKYISKKAD